MPQSVSDPTPFASQMASFYTGHCWSVCSLIGWFADSGRRGSLYVVPFARGPFIGCQSSVLWSDRVKGSW